MLYAVVGLLLLRKNRIENHRWFLWLAVFSIIFPYIANTSGWFTAEMGRQPWIIYNVMKVSAGHSKVLYAGQVIGSLIMFTLIYTMMSALFIFLLNRKIQMGPIGDDEEAEYRDLYKSSEGETV